LIVLPCVCRFASAYWWLFFVAMFALTPIRGEGT
jgi:hypothetical protein